MAQSGNRSNNTENESILDVLLEKAANIEHSTNQNTIARLLSEAIRLNAKRERTLRESTITIRMSDRLTKEKIMEEIENKWVNDMKQAPVTFWQDKESVFCQFVTPQTKNDFLDMVLLAKEGMTVKEAIARANSDGVHFQRRPVRLEIPNVRQNIKTDIIRNTLENLVSASGAIQEFKEGKMQAATRSRGVYFKTNSTGFCQLFKTIDGAIPYSNKETNTRARLFIKINAKPWQCRDCFKIGQHQCEGKSCSQCGNKGHLTADCKAKTKNCNNCRRKGHKAKDAHCPTYLNEMAKELRKMDLPLEFLEDPDLRFCLIKHLQLK